MTEWVLWLSITAITFVLSIVIILLVVIQLPTDYFTKLFEQNEELGDTSTSSETINSKSMQDNKLLRLTLKLVRNLFGLILLLAGIAMLFLPGQGLLTILLGVSLIDFPGKKSLLRWLFRKLNYVRLIGHLNTVRSAVNRPALLLPQDHAIQ